MTPELIEQTMREIIEPTMRGMAEMGAPFKGVLFAGLMMTDEGPEADRIQHPLRRSRMPGADDAAEGGSPRAAQCRLRWPVGACSARWRDEAALTVVMAAKGYPGHAGKGLVISGIDAAEASGAQVFHAGTKLQGRVSSPMGAAC
jgi:phosphoribosylamine--glycine ligase